MGFDFKNSSSLNEQALAAVVQLHHPQALEPGEPLHLHLEQNSKVG